MTPAVEGRWKALATSGLALTLNLAALGTLGALGFAAATSAENGVLMRNSVLLMPSAPAIDWSPERMPASFLQERQPAPATISAVALSLTPPLEVNGDPELAAALGIAGYIGDNPRRGGAVRSSTVEALRRVTVGGEGYCADYTQLFMALAHARGLTTREWGFGTDGFGAAHAFNEVYSHGYGKWVFVDSFNAFYVVDAASGVPLSVHEFQTGLLRGNARDAIRVVRISKAGFGFKTDADALAYFRAGAEYFYLFWGNNVFSYDANPAVEVLSRVSRAAEIMGAAVIGVQPRIVPVATATNARAIDQLRAIRTGMIAALVLALALGALLLWQVKTAFGRWRRARALAEPSPVVNARGQR